MKKEALALHGGSPIRSTLLPYGRQSITDADIEKVVEALKSDFVTCGPEVDRFEAQLADAVGARYAVAVSNGTAALHAACHAAGIGPGDEVITSPMTFAASANCILYQGGTPVFADIDPCSFNIDPVQVAQRITPRTRAILPVAYSGRPADMDALRDLADKHGLMLIEDAAHALGARYKGRKTGSIADMTEFSFHPVKHITTGEGGAVTTNDPVLYERLRLFRTHGITRDPSRLENRAEGSWYYEMQELGYNYRITDIQCALGSAQLARLGENLAVRRRIAAQYEAAFRTMDGVLPYPTAEDAESAWHLYMLQLDLPRLSCDRNTFFDALKAENIGVNVHYIPVHLHPHYRNLGYKAGSCPVAEAYYRRIITLPMFHSMTEADVRDVIRAVEKVTAWFRLA